MDSKKGKVSEVYLRKRKMMVFLPLVVLPLLTLGFYALGGGKGDKRGKGIVLTQGLNMNLPEAKFDTKKKALNKLGVYNQSEQDSIKLRESRKMDPYYGMKDSGAAAGVIEHRGPLTKEGPGGLMTTPAPTDAQAGELLQKLDLLKGALSRQQQAGVPDLPPSLTRGQDRADYFDAGLTGRPSAPLSMGPARAGQGDPDLDKLNVLMDKVLKVRYPGDVPLRDTLPVLHDSRPVQVLSVPKQEEIMSTLPADDRGDLGTGFIDLDDDRQGDSLAEKMIAAVVDGAQTLISGEAVGFRTAGDAMLGGIRVPRGTPISGKATLSGERLLISVNAVRVGTQVIPVSLEVVDMDGMAGIRVKGSINRDVSKESADEVVGSLGLTTVDPGVAGQATAAGLQAAKNLLSRKIRLVRVGLPEGYRVLLRNSKVNR
jgi:hypothetical protein